MKEGIDRCEDVFIPSLLADPNNRTSLFVEVGIRPDSLYFKLGDLRTELKITSWNKCANRAGSVLEQGLLTPESS